MINVIHQNGTSFKGLAAYLLHDKEASTSERVAWTYMHNLATDDPQLAWRLQVATAMNQADLKREAGIANTGRKSQAHVMHYTLSWHEEERDGLTRAEMIQAALASMTYIGTREDEKLGKSKKAIRTQYADEHQAVIVCHDEGPGTSPHVHIMLNRVHPEHGVMLPDSKDYVKLSAWALDYRQAQGKEHYCPERVLNEAKRAQGYLTSHPRKPRVVYEQEQEQQSADPGSRKAALLEQQKRRAAELKAKDVEQKQHQAEAIRTLEEQHLQNEKLERVRATEEARVAKAQVMDEHRVKLEALADRQSVDRQAFEDAQQTLRGRVGNAWSALKTKEWMTEIRSSGRLHATTHAFKLAFSSGMQQQQLDEFHTKEQQKQDVARRQAEQQAVRQVRDQEQSRLDERRRLFEVNRNDLLLKQEMDKAKLNAEWHQLQQDRRATAAEDERSRQAQHAREQVREATGQQEREQQQRNTLGQANDNTPPNPPPDNTQANDNTPPPQQAEDANQPKEQDQSTADTTSTAEDKPAPTNTVSSGAKSSEATAEKQPTQEPESTIQPEFNQAAQQPQIPEEPPDDDRARKMQDFADQMDHQREQGQDRDHGQDLTD